MASKPRIEYAGAIYHLMSLANGKGNGFETDVDRQDFVKTPGETCEKTGFQIHAYCLMRNHFHLVVRRPRADGNEAGGGALAHGQFKKSERQIASVEQR